MHPIHRRRHDDNKNLACSYLTSHTHSHPHPRTFGMAWQDTRYRKNKVTGEMELMKYRPTGSGCG